MPHKKIVFIINSIQNQRCVKRVSSFLERGAIADVYAFSRGDEIYSGIPFSVEVISGYDNNVSYRKRLPVLNNAMRHIVSKYDNDVVYYLFSMDVALFFRLHNRKSMFVYEESDLVHLYVHNSLLRNILEHLDKRIICKSERTVFTSPGFIEYHFGKETPSNAVVIPNKLNRSILNVSSGKQKPVDKQKPVIGFVGKIRYRSVFNFANTFCDKFPQGEFHFFGTFTSDKGAEMFEPLKKYDNCFFHGRFTNPDDLPSIYSSIDAVLSTYDITSTNVRYAEPNKLYEALYFKKPIIVSDNTYLSRKVINNKWGFVVDAMKPESICELIRNMYSTNRLEEVVESLNNVPQQEAVDNYSDFIDSILSL